MNARLRGDTGDESEPTPRPLEGLDGGAGSVDLSTPADRMNALVRRAAGRGSEFSPNGLPVRDA
jgi:hypothetical protein